MAGTRIGPVIGIDGEREYRDQINKMIQQARTLDSEMRAVTSAFTDSTTAEEKAARSAGTLTKQVDNQSRAVAEMTTMLEKSAQKFGENDIRTMKWQQSVNDATAELNRLENKLGDVTGSLDDVTWALDDTGGEALNLGDKINDITGKFGVNLPEGMTKSLNGITGLQAGMATASVAIIGAVAGIEKAFIDATLRQAEFARQIENLSQTTGMNTTEYQEWDFILKSVGHSAEQAQGDLSALAEKAMDAVSGEGEAAELFGKLGLSAQKLEESIQSYSSTAADLEWKTILPYDEQYLKTQQVLFTDLIASLLEMEDVTERNAIASALLGATGEAIVPLLNDGADAIENMKKKAHDFGVVLSEENVAALDEVQGKSLEFQAALDGLEKLIAAELAPALINLLETGIYVITDLVETMESSGIITFFSGLLDIVSKVSRALYDLGANTAKFSNVRTLGYNADGTDYWRGGLTWVGERGPEIVNLPRGSQVYSNEQSMRMLSSINITVNPSANMDEVAFAKRLSVHIMAEAERRGAVFS